MLVWGQGKHHAIGAAQSSPSGAMPAQVSARRPSSTRYACKSTQDHWLVGLGTRPRHPPSVPDAVGRDHEVVGKEVNPADSFAHYADVIEVLVTSDHAIPLAVVSDELVCNAVCSSVEAPSVPDGLCEDNAKFERGCLVVGAAWHPRRRGEYVDNDDDRDQREKDIAKSFGFPSSPPPADSPTEGIFGAAGSDRPAACTPIARESSRNEYVLGPSRLHLVPPSGPRSTGRLGFAASGDSLISATVQRGESSIAR